MRQEEEVGRRAGSHICSLKCFIQRTRHKKENPSHLHLPPPSVILTLSNQKRPSYQNVDYHCTRNQRKSSNKYEKRHFPKNSNLCLQLFLEREFGLFSHIYTNLILKGIYTTLLFLVCQDLLLTTCKCADIQHSTFYVYCHQSSTRRLIG